MKKSLLTAVAAFAAVFSAFSEIVLLSPEDGSTFDLKTDSQKKVFAGETPAKRLEILKTDCAKASRRGWRRQRPLVLKWRSTGSDKYPWRVRLATKADLSDAHDFWLEESDATRVKSKDGRESTWSFTVPRANLEFGKTYYWQVWSRVKCAKFSCGFTYPDKCECGKTKHGRISAIRSFKTTSEPPRWIEVEGRVKNIRDLGGWNAEGGKKVRMGMIYRGQGLNDNSMCGIGQGRNRLMVEDVAYLTQTLGIKTDLDLRSDRETAGMSVSPLGPSARYIRRSSPAYASIFKDKHAKTVAENFRVFCDRANYPVYFHCISGADRTGALAYILNGILGVAKADLERDWESTFYPELPGVDKDTDKSHRSTKHFDDGFSKYGEPGDTLQRRIELYLLHIGIKPEEISTFKKIMLED